MSSLAAFQCPENPDSEDLKALLEAEEETAEEKKKKNKNKKQNKKKKNKKKNKKKTIGTKEENGAPEWVDPHRPVSTVHAGSAGPHNAGTCVGGHACR